MTTHVEWPVSAAYEIPYPSRDHGKALVLLTARGLYEDVSANSDADQAARWLSLMLWGNVSANELKRAYEAWFMHHQIINGADLPYLLGVENTDAVRAAAASQAEGNLFAIVDFILDFAGVKR